MKQLQIDHALFKATILEQGAQLIHFRPTDKEPILWSAELTKYENGKAFRGGIPICWPWFGKAKSPSHGFARIMKWELKSRVDSEKGVALQWVLSDSEATREIWSYAFTLTLDMYLCETCTMKLTVDAPVQTTGALHTYLYSNDVRDECISGLGCSYIDSIENDKMVIDHSDSLLIDKCIDRIYTQSSHESVLKAKMRTVTVTHDNHSDVVVWNPWSDLALSICDMSNDDYLHMVCIETARISKPFGKLDSLGLRIGEKCFT